MSNIVIIGFGDAEEQRVEMSNKIARAVAKIEEVWITYILNSESTSALNYLLRRMGGKRKLIEPYLAIIFEKRDVESGQVKQIVEALEKAGINMIIEYHPIPLAQEKPKATDDLEKGC